MVSMPISRTLAEMLTRIALDGGSGRDTQASELARARM